MLSIAHRKAIHQVKALSIRKLHGGSSEALPSARSDSHCHFQISWQPIFARSYLWPINVHWYTVCVTHSMILRWISYYDYLTVYDCVIILLSPYHPSTMPILSHSITLLPHYDIIRWVTSFLFSTRNQSRNTLWKSYQRIHSDRRVISRNTLCQRVSGSYVEEYSSARESYRRIFSDKRAIQRNTLRHIDERAQVLTKNLQMQLAQIWLEDYEDSWRLTSSCSE